MKWSIILHSRDASESITKPTYCLCRKVYHLMKFTLGKCLIFDTELGIMKISVLLTVAIGIAIVWFQQQVCHGGNHHHGFLSETDSLVWTISSDAIDRVLAYG